MRAKEDEMAEENERVAYVMAGQAYVIRSDEPGVSVVTSLFACPVGGCPHYDQNNDPREGHSCVALGSCGGDCRK